MRQKEKTQLIVTAVLAVVLIVVISRNMKRRPKAEAGDAQPGAVRAAQAIPFRDQFVGAEAGSGQAAATGAVSRPDGRSGQATDLSITRDPFVEGRTLPRETASAGLVLSGIIWDEAKALAVINGRILQEGDRIGENMVINIGSGAVLLSDGTRELELRVE